ncbi:MAG: class I SAM-dependent methyltransferase [Gammaproteobacteria bacterium]|nr:class I SAM-dependent methyltransferase [Gammaproteobacteria bacterium]
MILDNYPEKYNRWYHTQYVSWVGHLEFLVLCQLIQPVKNSSLLDVGCGTGYFSRKFADYGLNVTGIDPDQAMIDFAISQNSDIHYIIGDAQALPFNKSEFDYSSAITSLCFISIIKMSIVYVFQ